MNAALKYIWRKTAKPLLAVASIVCVSFVIGFALARWSAHKARTEQTVAVVEPATGSAEVDALRKEVAELKAIVRNKAIVAENRAGAVDVDDGSVQRVDPPANEALNAELEERAMRRASEEADRQVQLRILEERKARIDAEIARREEQSRSTPATQPQNLQTGYAYGVARPRRNRIPESDVVADCTDVPAGYTSEQVYKLHDDRGWLLVTFDNKLPSVPIHNEDLQLVNLGRSGTRMLPLIAPDETCYMVPNAEGYLRARTFLFTGSPDSALGLRLAMVREMGNGEHRLNMLFGKVSAKGGVVDGERFENGKNWLARHFPGSALARR